MIKINQPSVAVVTATIGRNSLLKAIKSVAKQSYPCKHYIFVDGQQYHQKVQDMLKDITTEVVVTYLPMNSGADGMYNSPINAIAPYLAKEDIIFYLDDDNYYSEDHVKNLVKDMQQHSTEFGYSLRQFVRHDGEILCDDNGYSLGFWNINQVLSKVSHNKNTLSVTTNIPQGYLIDVNCLAIRRELAQMLATVWMETGYGNDRNITQYLLNNKHIGICNAKRSVYYIQNNIQESYAWTLTPTEKEKLGIHSADDLLNLHYQYFNNLNDEIHKINRDNIGKVPWEYKTLYKDGNLIKV
ncbi:hypothetical protein A1D22_03330 [Pasteurellaceae bacterium LFhippo2]|nr:hypothetical protein [Pasteurellaceae bacterium LFhippo2]